METTRTISFTRNNRPVTMDVLVEWHGNGVAWIKKANGRPFYGTTGYWSSERDSHQIRTYRHKEIVSNVTGLEGIDTSVQEEIKTRFTK